MIAQLRLVDFRNYDHLDVDVSASIVVLTGENGAGKTNILEALSLLSPGRGLRRATLADVTRCDGGHDGWGITAVLNRGGTSASNTLVVGTGLRHGETKRVWHIQHQPVRNALAIADHIRLLWFVPDMGRLFADGPSGRRRFLDRLVFAFEPHHADVVARYEHQLRERWLILKQGRDAARWLDRIENILAQDGVLIAQRRQLMCHLLASEAPRSELFPDVDMMCTGQLDTWMMDGDLDHARALFIKELASSRDHDRHTGGASIGPHKSDVVMIHRAKNRAATTCSTGEQKILLLSALLKFAALWQRHSTIPLVLLLDDVAAHLDPPRRAALFDELSQLTTQTWLSGTEKDVFTCLEDRAQFFHVENGRVKPYDGAAKYHGA